MISFPISPALSTCDSLASDELDALLEAQGELSHWPTPPLSEDELRGTEGSLGNESDGLDYSHIASMFTREASLEDSTSFSNIEPIQLILVRAQLPPEVLALAFNILVGLNRQPVPADSSSSAPSDLLVVSVLSLAVSYILDHPPSFSYWSRDVCDCRWSAQRIDEMGLKVLSKLDWRLHDFSSQWAIQQAMNRLLAAACDGSPKADVSLELADGLHTDSAPLKLETAAQLDITMEERPSHWANGQITPNATPIESDFECAWSFAEPVL